MRSSFISPSSLPPPLSLLSLSLSLCTTSKKSHEVRHKELLEGVASHLLKVAGEKAGEWAVSKPLAPLLLQMAASLPGTCTFEQTLH